jgi:hypothetical protein
MIFRSLNGLMAPLFLLAVLVQYNDPDPVRWMLIYGAACAVTAVVAAKGRIPMAVPLAVALIALGWAVIWYSEGPRSLVLYGHMFDSWQMKSAPVEEAREVSGLLIVTFWMGLVAFQSRTHSRKDR